MKYKRILFLLALLAIPGLALGQLMEKAGGTISGYAFGDYFWMANHHDSEVEGFNGFRFRRIYLTYDQQISESFSSRVRLEMNSSGDFQESGPMTPNIKDAYLKWENERHEILAGISPSPTFSLTEEVWGMRHIEKAPQDLFEFSNSRDFGISVKGTLDGDERLGYHFFLGNGVGKRMEVNRGKKIMLSLNYKLTDQFVIEAYADWDDRENGDTYTLQGFAAYQTDPFSVGALYTHQQRQNALYNEDLNLDLASLFTNFKLWDNGTGFLRVDHIFDPNPSAGDIDYLPMNPDAEATFLTGGVEIALESNVHISPNLEAIVYGETLFMETPPSDIIPRLTLFYEF